MVIGLKALRTERWGVVPEGLDGDFTQTALGSFVAVAGSLCSFRLLLGLSTDHNLKEQREPIGKFEVLL